MIRLASLMYATLRVRAASPGCGINGFEGDSLAGISSPGGLVTGVSGPGTGSSGDTQDVTSRLINKSIRNFILPPGFLLE
jgi:hypothetical protein